MNKLKYLNYYALFCIGINFLIFIVPSIIYPSMSFSQHSMLFQYLKLFNVFIIYFSILTNSIFTINKSYFRVIIRLCGFLILVFLNTWYFIYWGITGSDENWVLSIYFHHVWQYEIIINVLLALIIIRFQKIMKEKENEKNQL